MFSAAGPPGGAGFGGPPPHAGPYGAPAPGGERRPGYSPATHTQPPPPGWRPPEPLQARGDRLAMITLSGSSMGDAPALAAEAGPRRRLTRRAAALRPLRVTTHHGTCRLTARPTTPHAPRPLPSLTPQPHVRPRCKAAAVAGRQPSPLSGGASAHWRHHPHSTHPAPQHPISWHHHATHPAHTSSHSLARSHTPPTRALPQLPAAHPSTMPCPALPCPALPCLNPPPQTPTKPQLDPTQQQVAEVLRTAGRQGPSTTPTHLSAGSKAHPRRTQAKHSSTLAQARPHPHTTASRPRHTTATRPQISGGRRQRGQGTGSRRQPATSSSAPRPPHTGSRRQQRAATRHPGRGRAADRPRAPGWRRQQQERNRESPSPACQRTPCC